MAAAQPILSSAGGELAALIGCEPAIRALKGLFVAANQSTPDVLRAPWVIADPGCAFRGVAESSRYGWTLGAMILFTALFGYLRVESGLIDREVERSTWGELAKLEREKTDVMTRSELTEALKDRREFAEFLKLIARGGALLVGPASLVISLLLIASLLFVIVAMVGNKADYATLTAICVFAGVVDVIADGLRLAMMLTFASVHVDTSLAMIVPPADETFVARSILGGIDPFRIWFWILVAVGLVQTGQLKRRTAAITCSLFGLIAAGVHVGLAFAPQAS